MNEFALLKAIMARVESEVNAHRGRKHQYCESGHKVKAERAILMARELLLELRKNIDKKEVNPVEHYQVE